MNTGVRPAHERRHVTEHVELVRRLERLADLGVRTHEPSTAPDAAVQVTRGAVAAGDLVLVDARGGWRYAIAVLVTPRAGTPAWVHAAYLAATALDTAQRSWGRTSAEVLASTYPHQAAQRARRTCRDTRRADQAASNAREDAERAQAVARNCPRRPWAAVVPPRYVRRGADSLYRPVDQTIGTDAHAHNP